MQRLKRRFLVLLGSAAILANPGYGGTQEAPGQVLIPEGTEVSIRFEQSLSSGESRAGDQFEISLDDPIETTGGAVVRAGYRGQGHVVSASKAGLAGRKGQLDITLDSIQLGSVAMTLRGSQSKHGAVGFGNAMGAMLVFGVFGLLAARGTDVDINRGQIITAYVDAPVRLSLPLPPPPPDRP